MCVMSKLWRAPEHGLQHSSLFFFFGILHCVRPLATRQQTREKKVDRAVVQNAELHIRLIP